MNDKQKYCIEKCKSKCCKSFTIPHSYSKLKREYKNWITEGAEYSGLQDIDLIFPMLLPLSEGKVVGKDSEGNKTYEYKCKHLIKGKCSIYTIRPMMCKNFGTKYEVPKGKWKDCIYHDNKKGVK